MLIPCTESPPCWSCYRRCPAARPGTPTGACARAASTCAASPTTSWRPSGTSMAGSGRQREVRLPHPRRGRPRGCAGPVHRTPDPGRRPGRGVRGARRVPRLRVLERAVERADLPAPGRAAAALMADVVVLDDYQRVAARFGAWEQVEGEVRFVHEHLEDDALVEALADARVVVAMRERTAFDAGLLARLDRLELLVTTGGVNASIDVAAAASQGVTVCGTRSLPSPAAELTWALLLARGAAGAAGRPGPAHRRLADHDRHRARGRTLGLLGLGRARAAGRPGRPGLRDGRAGLVAEPRPGRRPRAGRRADRQGRPARPLRRGLAAPAALGPHPRRGRRPRAGADAPDVVPGEHLARTARRRVRSRRRAHVGADRRRRARRVRPRSRCPSTTRSGRRRTPCSPRISATSPTGPTRCSTATPWRTWSRGRPACRCGSSSPEQAHLEGWPCGRARPRLAASEHEGDVGMSGTWHMDFERESGPAFDDDDERLRLSDLGKLARLVRRRRRPGGPARRPADLSRSCSRRTSADSTTSTWSRSRGRPTTTSTCRSRSTCGWPDGSQPRARRDSAPPAQDFGLGDLLRPQDPTSTVPSGQRRADAACLRTGRAVRQVVRAGVYLVRRRRRPRRDPGARRRPGARLDGAADAPGRRPPAGRGDRLAAGSARSRSSTTCSAAR